MIHTQDDHIVDNNQLVYEIRYTWYNAETSLAEPYPVLACEAVGKVWLYQFPCSMECLKINKANKYPDLREKISTVKMIAH